LFVEGCMSYLRYLCLLAHSGVQHILCCFFALLWPRDKESGGHINLPLFVRPDIDI
jgi:hypothetical protein